MTWAVESLKSSHFDEFLLSKSYKVSTKNVRKGYLSGHLGVMQSLKKNCLVVSNDMRNFVNFHPTTLKSENLTLMGSFYSKYKRFELKQYRGVIFHDIEQWCKIGINPDLVVSKMARGIGCTFIRAPKSQKNCTLMGFFCQKHIVFQLEYLRGIMSHDTGVGCKVWRKTEFRFQKWLIGEF